MKLFKSLRTYSPRYGPEWGSGGIFGLKYHKDTLYYTLAFEAEAHFVKDYMEYVYRFEQVGPAPHSGGDTYNAVDAVDEFIYFGGWVHAPASYKGKNPDGSATIDFYNKYSHVHEYDTYDNEVRLLWTESIHKDKEWTGEISNILYDPVNDRLLLSRLDGHANLGVYSMDRRNGSISRLSDTPSLKGVLIHDLACFEMSRPGLHPTVYGLQFLDLVDGKFEKARVPDEAFGKFSLDGGYVETPRIGTMASAYLRIFVFLRGGLLIYDVAGRTWSFVRLFDFLSGYGPFRTVAINLGGGILVAFNAFTHGIWHFPGNSEEVKRLNFIVGPSVLLYITPPMAKIVLALGARITSFERVGDMLILGTSTVANLGGYDATPIDSGYREILAVRLDRLLTSPPPPVEFLVPASFVLDKHFGGIPLLGYRDPRLLIEAHMDNKLEVHEYSVLFEPIESCQDIVSLKRGKNIIDLSSYRGIVSFRLSQPDPRAIIRISLQ